MCTRKTDRCILVVSEWVERICLRASDQDQTTERGVKDFVNPSIHIELCELTSSRTECLIHWGTFYKHSSTTIRIGVLSSSQFITNNFPSNVFRYIFVHQYFSCKYRCILPKAKARNHIKDETTHKNLNLTQKQLAQQIDNDHITILQPARIQNMMSSDTFIRKFQN